MKARKTVTVLKNSYVMLNRHHYSVPKDYIGKRVDIIYDADTLHIFHGLKLVTVHQRDDTPYAYTQKEAHNLPGRHGSYEKDLEEIYERAGAIDNRAASRKSRNRRSIFRRPSVHVAASCRWRASTALRDSWQPVPALPREGSTATTRSGRYWSVAMTWTSCRRTMIPRRLPPAICLRRTGTYVAGNITQINHSTTKKTTTMETNSKTAPIMQEKEQNQVTLDLMHRMRLTGMAAAFEESLTSTYAEAMTPDAFVSWLLAREWDYRSSAAIERLIRGASFRYNAYPEEIDYTINRGLSQNQMERLLSLDFVRQGQNLFITGSAGTGKSFLATAVGYHACKNGIRTLYSNTSKLLSSLKVAKAKNTIETELKKIERCQLLILDDAFLVPLDAKERPILLDIIEDRHERKSIVLASQLPVDNWYDAIGDPAVADAVLDRIVHTAHRIELTGESVRKMKLKK